MASGEGGRCKSTCLVNLYQEEALLKQALAETEEEIVPVGELMAKMTPISRALCQS